ncbi:MAG TPA: hypothetical protein VMV49_03035 [Candidatus Deferrimicrobium sp.]|nr:hypothetical protein [Candidatus Deferrimicrobium sp.]
MEELSRRDLVQAINRASKFAVRAIKRSDDTAAFNSLKALVHMHIRANNYKKALEIIHTARDLYPEF